MSGATAKPREERREEFCEVVGEGLLRCESRRVRRESFSELRRRGSLCPWALVWAVGDVGGEWKGRAPASPVFLRASTAGCGAGVVVVEGEFTVIWGGGRWGLCWPIGGAGGKPAEGAVGA